MSDKLSPWDFLNSINLNKKDLLDDCLPEEEKQYVPFMVNRGLGYFPDTVGLANAMNCNHHLPGKMQYDFLRMTVRKRKRFGKWLKAEEDARIDVVKEYYGYSNDKARDALKLLSEEDIEEMKSILFKGGRGK
jgi:hypothetical protein